MANSREEEYLRRMKARGYEPSLAGMDDDDIEWELDKMDGKNPLQEARPAERPLFPGYKPPDPAMVARIYRQMGRPYDASLIPEKEKYYLNGWDNDDDDDINDPRKNLRPLKQWPPVEPFDPFKNVWKLDWGPEGSPADRVRTLEFRPERGGGAEARTMEYRPERDGGAKYVPLAAEESGGLIGEINKKYGKYLGILGSAINNGKGASDFGKEVEQEALKLHPDNPELARKKGEDAAGSYGTYLTILSGFGGALGGGAGAAGSSVIGANTSDWVKKAIKDQVLGRTDAFYNQLAPGYTPPGPY